MEIKKLDDGSYDVVCKSRLHIVPNNDGTYAVESDSGHTYTVSHRSPEYEEDTHIYKCNCPAGQHGRDCKHLDAVIAVSNAIDVDPEI